MSRSKHAVELCALLVDETYGELTSRIFTILLRRGRLQIHQLSAHTRLTKHQIQHGLTVLIQQNLVYHFMDKADDRTYYEASHDAAYALVRSGKIVELVESRLGPYAKNVIQNLLLLGHVKVSDLEDAYAVDKPLLNGHGTEQNGTNGANGVNEKHEVQIHSSGQLHHALTQLLQAGYIEIVIERMFRSPTDAHAIAEKQLLRELYGGQLKGTKQKEELKTKVRLALLSGRDGKPDWRPHGSKRAGDATNGVNGQGKKRRLSRGEATMNGFQAFLDTPKLDRNLVVRVNYEKCTVAFRNHRLVQLASSRIGETTAQIYAELLRLMEERIPRCRIDPTLDDVDDTPPDGPSVSTNELSAALSRSVHVSKGIGDTNLNGNSNKPNKSPKGKTKASMSEAEVEGEASSDDDDDHDEDVHMNGNGNIPEAVKDEANDLDDPFGDDPRPAKRAKVTFQDKLPKPKPDRTENPQLRLLHLKAHLSLLAEDSIKFIRKAGHGGSNEWTVDFEVLVEQLRETEMDSIILETFGQGGHRLVRMLRKLGKLEEKALPGLSLMKPGDVRTALARMQVAGIVDIQEVPRDASRTTQRTIFLWYYDAARATSIVMDRVYKTMSRCLQRLEIEKRRASGILSMAERTDVRDTSEQEVFSEEQLKMLQEIRSKEDRILGQVARLDDLVGVFRDY